MKQNNLFKHKIVLITGAASGIGLALSNQLEKLGAVVYRADIKPIKAQHSLTFDVANRQQFKQAFAQIMSEQKRIDYIFNNAGIAVGGKTELMTDEIWRKTMDVNFWGVVYGTELAYEQMRQQGFGHIINTSSTAGIVPVPHAVAYTASKHAVVGLTTSLYQEAKTHNIKLSVLIPGMISTNIYRNAINLEGFDFGKQVAQSPIKEISAETAAAIIIKGVKRGKLIITFPLVNKLFIKFYQLAPNFVSKLMSRVM